MSLCVGKYGRIPSILPDHAPDLLKLKSIAGTQPPDHVDRSHLQPHFKMFHNDFLGDCTSAGIANALIAITALSNRSISIPEQCAVQFYSESTGYDPNLSQTDLGGCEPDVLTYAQTHGYPTEFYRFYPIWGSIAPKNRNAIANCIHVFGVVYMGIDLYQIDEDTLRNDQTLSHHTKGDMTPVGGHCALLWDYTGLKDDDVVSIISWGRIVKATWGWLKLRMEESHILAFRQLLSSAGRDHLGQDWDTLVQLNQAYLDHR